MSYWTYIRGVIEVWPMGRTQPETRYILDTVLEHLPAVTGSERDMHVEVIQKTGYTSSSNCNEFGEFIPGKCHHVQNHYQVIIYGDLRDRMFDATLRELNKWLNRLAKRVFINDILVKIRGQDEKLIISNPKPYQEMEECPTWSCDNKDGNPAWTEYLMWDRAKDSDYPLKLAYKYFNDPEIDAELDRRRKWEE